jgi:quinol monooxygenase YgiN
MGNTLGARLLKLVECSHCEAGCLSYEAFQDADNSESWFVIAGWKSAEDFDARIGSSYISAFMKDVPSFCTGAVKIETHVMQSCCH